MLYFQYMEKIVNQSAVENIAQFEGVTIELGDGEDTTPEQPTMSRRGFLSGIIAAGVVSITPGSVEAQSYQEQLNRATRRALEDDFGLPADMIEPMMERLQEAVRLSRGQEMIFSRVPAGAVMNFRVALEIDGSRRYNGQTLEELLVAPIRYGIN